MCRYVSRISCCARMHQALAGSGGFEGRMLRSYHTPPRAQTIGLQSPFVAAGAGRGAFARGRAWLPGMCLPARSAAPRSLRGPQRQSTILKVFEEDNLLFLDNGDCIAMPKKRNIIGPSYDLDREAALRVQLDVSARCCVWSVCVWGGGGCWVWLWRQGG